jgi:hypothetical protein
MFLEDFLTNQSLGWEQGTEMRYPMYRILQLQTGLAKGVVELIQPISMKVPNNVSQFSILY